MNPEYGAVLVVHIIAKVGTLVAALAMGACSGSGPRDAVDIREYHLRSLDADTGDVASLRAEKLRRLRGAVSLEQQRQRLGHYYTIRWEGPAGLESEPVRVVFKYRQTVTGSEVKTRELTAPGGEEGSLEFQITGSGYLEGGHVLAWHLSFYRGDKLVESHESYLWN